jgi:hypothetical protein
LLQSNLRGKIGLWVRIFNRKLLLIWTRNGERKIQRRTLYFDVMGDVFNDDIVGGTSLVTCDTGRRN